MGTDTATTEEGNKGNAVEVDLSTIPTPGASRMAAMDNISDSRVAQLAEENEIEVGDIRGAEPKPEPEPEPEPEPTPKEEDEITPENQIAKALVEDEENTFVTMKVNGVEQEVSVAQMRVDAQKVRSATQKFEDAAQLRREAEEIVEKAKKNTPAAEATPESNAAEATPADANAQPSVNTDAVNSAVDALYAGDEEAAKAALIELLSNTGRDQATTHDEQPIDTTAVATEVMEQIERTNALNEFKSEYQDVWKNPMLAGQADSLLATKLDEGMDFKEALLESGSEVREMVADMAKSMGFTETPKEKTPPEKETNKAERKKAIENIPSSGKTASTTVAEEASQGVSSVIAEMAKSRGANRQFNMEN